MALFVPPIACLQRRLRRLHQRPRIGAGHPHRPAVKLAALRDVNPACTAAVGKGPRGQRRARRPRQPRQKRAARRAEFVSSRSSVVVIDVIESGKAALRSRNQITLTRADRRWNAQLRRKSAQPAHCIRDHTLSRLALSYNGRQSHSRKLRVSLSVIGWIPCSSPLESFQNRGSRNRGPDTRDESNVRSEGQGHSTQRQDGEARPARTATRQLWRMGDCSGGRLAIDAVLTWPGSGSADHGSGHGSQTIVAAGSAAVARFPAGPPSRSSSRY